MGGHAPLPVQLPEAPTCGLAAVSAVGGECQPGEPDSFQPGLPPNSGLQELSLRLYLGTVLPITQARKAPGARVGQAVGELLPLQADLHQPWVSRSTEAGGVSRRGVTQSRILESKDLGTERILRDNISRRL